MPKPKKNEAKQDYLKRCTGELVGREGTSADQAYALCNAYWDDAHSQRAALSLSAPVAALEQKEALPPGFLITAYTGRVIDRGWLGRLIIQVAGIKTKAKLPVLREHARDRVVGFSRKSWVENNNLFLEGEFSRKTTDGQEVLALAEDGFPWEASIGVWPRKVKVLDSDKEEAQVNGMTLKGPLEIWTESEVREVSFVALGEDEGTAAINFSLEEQKVKVQLDRGQTPESEEGQDMSMTLEQLEMEAPELLAAIRETERQSGVQQGEQAERARVLEILTATGPLTVKLEAVSQGQEPKAAFRAMLDQQEAEKARALAELAKAAPSPVGQQVETTTGPGQELPLEQRALVNWEREPQLRQEFGELETYLAFLRAEESGRAKIKSA
jgi:hypothetical protein